LGYLLWFEDLANCSDTGGANPPLIVMSALVPQRFSIVMSALVPQISIDGQEVVRGPQHDAESSNSATNPTAPSDAPNHYDGIDGVLGGLRIAAKRFKSRIPRPRDNVELSQQPVLTPQSYHTPLKPPGPSTASNIARPPGFRATSRIHGVLNSQPDLPHVGTYRLTLALNSSRV
jgi:hypothetical protein